ncbi:beta-hexosaminidase-like [Mya arenaria]|uniref:beta-hexosaminidase-like n=1 Tax=Mya arenaria TaxID=6604 RepID=UPI0022E74E3E|nr:beta-hexosaminidase-like [Mya arenaria]
MLKRTDSLSGLEERGTRVTMVSTRRCLSQLRRRNSLSKLSVMVICAGICILLIFGRSGTTGSTFYIPHVLFGEGRFPPVTQSDLEYFGHHVQLNITVDTNFIKRSLYSTHFDLTNRGPKAVEGRQWELYGYFFRLGESKAYPYPRGFYLWSCGLKMFHVNGYLYKFTPVYGLFTGIPSGGSVTCKLRVQGMQVSRTDSFPRWYVTGNDLMPKVIINTDDESLSFVSDLTHPEQYKKYSDDTDHPYTPQDRFNLYAHPKAQIKDINVVPTPLEMTRDDSQTMTFDTDLYPIVKNEKFAREIKEFANQMDMKIVSAPPQRSFVQVTKSSINLYQECTADKKFLKEAVLNEAYILETFPAKKLIKITASSASGVFYAFQTLISVLFKPEAVDINGISIVLPKLRIVDAPRFSYRGLHLDVARNFIEADSVLKMVEVMSMYKMNKLHLHLSDDEGWRLEIPGLPELTQIGGSRCHDPKEEECILPMLGSGPYSNTSGSGFFTVQDYKDILEYARDRHVQVIPEFDMPGHSRAAIRSVHAKQRANREQKKANVYSIIDESSKQPWYRSGQHFSDDAMNPCIEGTYQFIEKIISSVKALHADIQPLETFHFGGDEVAVGAWRRLPACKNILVTKENGGFPTHYELMQYFIGKVSAITSQHGLALAGWEDAFLSHDTNVGFPFQKEDFKNDIVYAYVWKRTREVRTPHRAKLLANGGYKVVLAYGAYLYFDHPYEPDPEERGLYWATRKISTKDVWGLTPRVIFQDDDLECPDQIKAQENCFKLLKPHNILGMQAEVWTEVIRTPAQLEYMLFPRLLAVAERAWHHAAWEESSSENAAAPLREADWAVFAAKLGYQELRRLDTMDVQYRVSPPGARTQDSKAEFQTEFPGQEIQYLAANGIWTTASHNMPVRRPLKIRGLSSNGSRSSRVVILDPSFSAAILHTAHAQTILISVTFICFVLKLFKREFKLL